MVELPISSSLYEPRALGAMIAEAYGLEEPIRCYLYTRGINDTYIIDTANGRFALRIYPSGHRTPSEVMDEIYLSDNLLENGISVAPVFRRLDEEAVTFLNAPEGRRCAVLFVYMDHKPVDDLNDKLCFRLGRTLAQIHEIADFLPSLDREQMDVSNLVDEPLARIANSPLFAQYGEEIDYLYQVAGELRQRLSRLPTQKPHYGICHGDFMTGNILINKDQLPSILDFDFAQYNWRIYDLATFIWLEALDDNPNLPTIRKMLVQGYETIRPLREIEHQMLDDMVLVRHLWLLGGSGLNHIGRHGVQWLSGDYFPRFIQFISKWREKA